VTELIPGDLSPEACEELADKPAWRGRLHQIAFFISLPAGAVLLFAADSTLGRVAVFVYLLSLAAAFAASASYHLLGTTPFRTKWLRRLDHSMIFILIGGTYTPICLLVMPPRWGIPLLIAVWATVAAGVVMKMVRVQSIGNNTGSWLYIVLGWAGILALPQLITTLSATHIALLAAGGLFFSVGVVVLAKRRPDPRPTTFGYHEVWHAFSIGGIACHFAVVAMVAT
jgi:hemolysin III